MNCVKKFGLGVALCLCGLASVNAMDSHRNPNLPIEKDERYQYYLAKEKTAQRRAQKKSNQRPIKNTYAYTPYKSPVPVYNTESFGTLFKYVEYKMCGGFQEYRDGRSGGGSWFYELKKGVKTHRNQIKWKGFLLTLKPWETEIRRFWETQDGKLAMMRTKEVFGVEIDFGKEFHKDPLTRPLVWTCPDLVKEKIDLRNHSKKPLAHTSNSGGRRYVEGSKSRYVYGKQMKLIDVSTAKK